MKRLTRRQVIKTIALGTAFSSTVRSGWSDEIVAASQFAGGFSAGVLRVNLSEFPALAEPFGSVRLGTFPVGPDRKSDAWLKPILINRGGGEELHVLSSVCTHEGCILPRSTEEGGVITCPQDGCGHGSQYEADGTVRQGPARSHLSRYQYTREGDLLKIAVPDIFFDVTVDRVSAGRIRIQFVAFYQTTYEVYFVPASGSTVQRANFSLTPDGQANLQEVEGNFNSEYATLYLDKPGAAGFYQVAIKTTPV